MTAASSWILFVLVCAADSRDLKVELKVHSTEIRFGDPIYACLTVKNGGTEVQILPTPLCSARTQKYELRQNFLTWGWRFGGEAGVPTWNVGADQTIGSLTSLEIPIIEYVNHDFWRGGKYELFGAYYPDTDFPRRCHYPTEIRILPRTEEEWTLMREIERLLQQISGEKHFYNRDVPEGVIPALENEVKEVGAGSYKNKVLALIFTYKLASETVDQNREQHFADYLKWLDTLHPFERHFHAQSSLFRLMQYDFSDHRRLGMLLDRIYRDEKWVNGSVDRDSYQQSLREFRARIGKRAVPR